ncbi:MAG: YafY family protein [bacterium]|nr:YafY family protein [bacterium]
MKINRLFEIVYLLLDHKTLTAKELAERFEVSTRTIYRDIENLSIAGIPIYMSKGKGGGISLLPDFIFNKSVLSEEEKSGILASLQAVSSVRPEEAAPALAKLSTMLGGHDTDWIEVDFSSWANLDYENTVFSQLKEAILRKQIVSFDYVSGKKESTTRTVLPLKLCFKGQAWYLYAFCKTRKEERFFKLRRLHHLFVTETSFEYPTPKKVLSNTKIPAEHMVSIRLKVSKEMAFRVYDEVEQFEVDKEGNFLCTVLMPNGRWISDYICSLGEYCEVIEPAWLRSQIKEQLERTLKRYE